MARRFDVYGYFPYGRQMKTVRNASERARVDFRPRADQKALFERAAALEGQTLSEFLIRSAERRARELIQEHETLRLRGEAAERFVSLLLSPPEPNARLREAASRHAAEIG